MSTLTPDQIMLALMTAVSEDGKKMVSDAVRDMLAAKTAAEAAQAALREKEEKNQELLKEAQDQAAENDKMAAANEAKRRELEAFEVRLGEANAALNAEKTKFEDVRVQVNADYNARGAAIGEREARLDRREREIGDLMMKNTAEAKRLAELGEKLDRSVSAMKAALAELDADPPVDAG